MQPYENRVRLWTRAVQDLPLDKLEAMTETCGLDEVMDRAKAIPAVRGRL